MIARPILRPIACLRAVARMTASLTGKTGPASSRASRNAGQQPVGACASASGARTQSGVRRARAISLRPPHRRAAGRRVDLACAECRPDSLDGRCDITLPKAAGATAHLSQCLPRHRPWLCNKPIFSVLGHRSTLNHKRLLCASDDQIGNLYEIQLVDRW